MASPKPFRPNYSLDPANEPRRPTPQPTAEPEPTHRPSEHSPFSLADAMAEPAPGQELCIMAFPIKTFQILSDEAARRGLTFAEATQQAYDEWLRKLIKE